MADAQAKALPDVRKNPPPAAWMGSTAGTTTVPPGGRPYRAPSARRSWRVGEDGPEHAAWYDLADASALQSSESLAHREREMVYDQQFMGRLLQVGRRVCQQFDGHSPSFLAVLEHERLSVLAAAGVNATVGTPWRYKVLGYATRRERFTFQLLRTL